MVSKDCKTSLLDRKAGEAMQLIKVEWGTYMPQTPVSPHGLLMRWRVICRICSQVMAGSNVNIKYLFNCTTCETPKAKIPCGYDETLKRGTKRQGQNMYQSKTAKQSSETHTNTFPTSNHRRQFCHICQRSNLAVGHMKHGFWHIIKLCNHLCHTFWQATNSDCYFKDAERWTLSRLTSHCW